MGSQPGTQQRPEPLDGINMDPMAAIAVVVTSVVAPAMAHGRVVETPFRPPMANLVLIDVHPSARRDESLGTRADRGLPDVFQQADHHRPAPLDPAENRRLFAVQRAAPLSGAAAGLSTSFFHRLRMTLMAAIACIAFHLSRQDRFRRADDDFLSQGLGHPLGVVWIQPQRLGDLSIG